MPIASTLIDDFRALHEAGCFLMPNPWDIGTAMFLQHAGFPALATTSAGFAFGQGRADTADALSCDPVLEHALAIVGAVTVPVSVDFQSGYAAEAEGVEANVARCLDTGAAGLSIEDASGSPSAPLFDRARAVERVRAACAARDAVDSRAVVTARCEAWLVGVSEPKRTALDRLVAFADAGADCLFAPGVRNPADIAEIVGAVAPKPVNVLCSAPAPEFLYSRLADLGVRRISVGSALARVAWGAFRRAARSIAEHGVFDTLAGASSFDELNGFFARRR